MAWRALDLQHRSDGVLASAALRSLRRPQCDRGQFRRHPLLWPHDRPPRRAARPAQRLDALRRTTGALLRLATPADLPRLECAFERAQRDRAARPTVYVDLLQRRHDTLCLRAPLQPAALRRAIAL